MRSANEPRGGAWRHALGIEHVLCTGDVTNLALAQEFEFARGKFDRLAAGPTHAFGGVKRLLLESVANKLETQMALETDWITQMARTRDGREGIEAFVGKRAPQFKGE